MTPSEARQHALRALGGMAQIAEACRDTRRVTPLQDLLRDVQYAWRMLAKNRVFATIAVLTLSLGIGATTAIFSVVNGVLLRPLPYPEASRIVSLGTLITDTGHETSRLTGGDITDLLAGSRSVFDAFSPYWGGEVGVQVEGAGSFAGVYWVAPSFFKAFSASTSSGRVFGERDRAQAAVVAEGLAARLFGRAERAVGRSVSVEDHAYEIVGVLPHAFSAPGGDAELWLPMPTPLPGIASERTAFNFHVVARLAPGVSLEQSRARVATIGAQLAHAFPASNKNRSFTVVPLRDRLVAPIESTLYLLLGAVLLLLLVACVNVANLLLARATTRTHEIAVRIALGAGRGRIARQLVAESLLLAVIGGGLGLAVAGLATDALMRLAPDNLPRLAEVVVDWRVLGFAAACSLAASLIFGLAPAWQVSRVNPHDGLRQASPRGVVAGRSTRLRTYLVVGEIALSFALTVGGGLLFRSFVALTSADLGYRQDSILVMTAHKPAKRLEEYVQTARFFSRIASDFAAIPGVTAVGTTMGLPTGPYGSNGTYLVDGRGLTLHTSQLHADFGLASPGCFRALGIAVVRGRDFADSDTYDSPLVAMVNRALAREAFGGDDPIGKRVLCGLDSPDKWMTIVGVVGDVRQDSPGVAPAPQLYMPLQQHPYYANEVQVVLRTALPPDRLAPVVRSRMQQLAPESAVKFTTMERMVASSVGTPRFRTMLVAAFSALAVLLAMAGVYGVMACLTAQRVSEFGLRLALGAARGQVFGLVLGRAARLAAAGLALGFVLSLATGRLIASMLFGLTPADPLTYAAVTALVTAVALAAGAVPAWIASRVDPVTALRGE